MWEGEGGVGGGADPAAETTQYRELLIQDSHYDTTEFKNKRSSVWDVISTL